MRMISLPRRSNLSFALLLVFALAGWFAYHNAFTQDDAYISYRYAKYFSQGHGLVWYPGSKEFGYTNFLYSFVIGVAMLFGAIPNVASNVINVACFFGVLWIVHAMCVRLIAHRWLALLPVVLLATHHTFTSYATGGLETMPLTLLVVFFYYLILTRKERSAEHYYLCLGTLAALSLFMRLDSALLLLPGYVFTLFDVLVVNRYSLAARLREMAGAIIIPVVAVAGFLLCCYLAYGQILPNSFYVKMPGSDNMVKYGTRYLLLYNATEMYMPLLVPLLVIYFGFSANGLRKLSGYPMLMAGILLVWFSYVVFVGGDFMEFRLLVPVLPFYYLLVFVLIGQFLQKYRTQVTLLVAAAYFAGQMMHPVVFRTQPGIWDFPQRPHPFFYAFVEDTNGLDDWITNPQTGWRDIGRSLGGLLRGTDVVLATTAIGAISYYSGLETVDLLGLNTKAVRSGNRHFIARPGHESIATDALVKSLGVNLNLSHPQTVCRRGGRYFFTKSASEGFNFERHETLLLPVSYSCYVVADYVTKHPQIEALIEKKTVLRYRNIQYVSDCPDWLCRK